MDTTTVCLLAGAALTCLVALIALVPSSPRLTSLKRLGKDPGFLRLNSNAASRDYEAGSWKMAEAQYLNDKQASFFLPAISRVVLSPRYISELNQVSEDILSHRHSFAERFMGHITGMNVVLESRIHADLVRVQLTQNLRLSTLSRRPITCTDAEMYQPVCFLSCKMRCGEPLPRVRLSWKLRARPPVILYRRLGVTDHSQTINSLLSSSSQAPWSHV